MTDAISCDNCGTCCSEMNSPPFMPEYMDPGGEMSRLPRAVRQDYDAGMRQREADGWPDDEMCFWLVWGCKCKHYEHRPDICREFVVGSDACLIWRERLTNQAVRP